jgi:uncharacterized membrane protein (DUF4010 family)
MELNRDLLTGLALALGLGLLIGVERERRKGEGAQRRFAGLRTFALVSLCGATAQSLHQPLLTLVAALLVVLLIAIAYWRDRSDDPGVTTEVALFLTFLLGVLAMERAVLAAGLAVVVAALLAARTPLQRFATQTLSARELRDALVLAGAALLILPQAPNEALSWLGGVNPYRVWLLVVSIMALQAAGHVAQRWLGPSLGLPLSGLAAGFVSSTATVGAMGAMARAQPTLTLACVCAALLSTVATSLQLGLITLLLAPALLVLLWPSLACAFVSALVLALAAYRRGAASVVAPDTDGRAFSLPLSIGMALLLSAMMALVAWLQSTWGATATYAAAALGGLADVHGASAAVLALAANDPALASMVLPAVLLAFFSNTLSKMVAAFAAGGARYGAITSGGLVLVAAAAGLPWLVQRWT